MKKPKHLVLYIPAEIFPTHHSLMTEVYSKNDYPVKTVFLMRHNDADKINREQSWNKAFVYLFPRHSKHKVINSIKTYFCIDIRYLYLIPYVLLKHKITIIQVRDLTFPLLLSLLLKAITNKKVIYQKSFPHEYRKKVNALSSQHKFPWLVQRTTSLENKFLHYSMKFCDAIFPISKYMAENLQSDYGLPAQKMHPLGLGFNFENMPKKKCGCNVDINDSIKIIYVGTLSMSRNFDILLNGIKMVIDRLGHRKIQFEFVGGTEQEICTLKKIADGLSIRKYCLFTGKIRRDEVYGKIAVSHIGISWFGKNIRFVDASPTKMIEYLSVGIPVIAVDSVILHREILERTNAGLSCQVDANDFSSSLFSLISHFDQYKKNAANGIEYMQKKYSYSTMLNHIIHVYNRM